MSPSELLSLGYQQYRQAVKGSPLNGLCIICRNPEAVLVIDHCHKHGWVRDRICPSCNTRLGFIEKTERAVNFATIGSYDYDVIEQLALCPECAEVYFKVAPPHLRPNWRAGYFNEASRFKVSALKDSQACIMRYSDMLILDILEQLTNSTPQHSSSPAA